MTGSGLLGTDEHLPAAEASSTATPDRGSSTTYRAHLDGLRALAVYLVVAFHAGLARLAGGFVGVDVFFVLSGYLVTQVLLRDVVGHGKVRFGRFYARRFRRLLPASFVTLVVTATVYAALADPGAVEEARAAFRAAFLYVANWFFIDRSTDYFAEGAARSPVLHFWSLAVEEQFYLLWPLLFGGLAWLGSRTGPRRWLVPRLLVAAGALASVAWAFALKGDQPDRAYMGTDTRAYQLLAGAFLALTPHIAARAARFPRLSRAVVPGAVLAVVALSTSWVDLDPIERGLAVTIVTGALVVALDSSAGGPVQRLLGSRPLVYLGQVSYGTYLWHWPVIIVALEVTAISPRALAAVTALLATGLASLSFQLVEHPIRVSGFLDGHRRAVVATGLAISVVSALVVVPAVTGSSAGSGVVEVSSGGWTEVPEELDVGAIYFEGFGETVDCTDRRPEACVVERGSGPHVMLMGDSNAQMLIPAFRALARDEDLTLSLAVSPGCLWQREAYRLSAAIRAKCRVTKEDAYERVVPALAPDVIVLVNTDTATAGGADRTGSEVGRTIDADTRPSLDRLDGPGREFVLVEPLPRAADRFNPRECLGKARFVEECRFVVPTSGTWIEDLYREVAGERDDVTVVDLDRLACPFLPICDPIVDGTVVFWNDSHLTARYSESLAGDLARVLRAEGVLDP